MSLLLFVLTVTVPAGQDWFYPGAGDEIAMIEQGAAGYTIGGLPVERTGNLLARVADPKALGALPEVSAVEVLRGDGHVVRVHTRPGVDEIALSRTLHERDDVVWSHPDFAMELVAHSLPNDPFVRDQWHLSNIGQRGWTPGVDINAELAWTKTTGKGGLVAVIDTGVQSTHPDLSVRLGYDYVDGDDDSNPVVSVDGSPHGTAVAGTAAAIGNNGIGVAGVAYGSTIYAIRLIGGRTSLGDFYNAFVEAVDAGAWVLSNSWGYGEKCDDVPDFAEYGEAMAYAETMGRGGLGSVVVFAAGNGNCDIGKNKLLAQPEMVVVAATNGDDRREGYSSFGAWVDVAAPSGTILTTDLLGKDGYGSWDGDPDYSGYFSGTSAATPIVSGTFLLMFAANPRLTAAQARRVLCDTAAKIDLDNGKYDAKGWSPYYGCGRVDAGAAVMAVANSVPGAPLIVAPLKSAWAERVVLEWQPAADADGDWLTYRVTWRVDGSDADTVVDLTSGETHLDITESVAPGENVIFSVQAADLWGPGAASAPTTFAVESHPIPAPPAMAKQQGCGCRLGNRAVVPNWTWLVAGLLVVRRLRRSRSV